MTSKVISSLNAAVGYVLPERQLYIRSEKRTRYWTLSPLSQAGIATVFLLGVGWTGLTTASFFDRVTDGRNVENRLEATVEAYEIKLAALHEQQRLLEEELNRSNARGDAVTAELSAKQRVLVEKATSLHTAAIELAGLRKEYESLVTARRAERDEVNRLNEEIIALRLALGDAQRSNAVAATTLDAFSATMNGVIEQRDVAASKAGKLDTRVATLETEIGQWKARQENLIAQLEDATRVSLASFDKLFKGSRVNVDKILKETKRDYTGRGGPLDASDRDDDAEAIGRRGAVDDSKRVASLMSDLERMSLMRVAVERLPFGVPTTGAERTSGFGKRRDPYRRSWRMHNGVDYAAPRGTPIYSTGEGVVSFSGRQSGYGIVVKIRHAFGFETVYAHLSKSRVKVGQRVKRGQRIADMGSTGRSTGSHLHYEVRIDGVPVNPSKFIGAAKNVL